MIRISVADAKAKLSEYLDRALHGERVVICRHNEPIIELCAIEAARAEPRPLGPLPGRPTFDVAATFFDPIPDEELDLWDGGGHGSLSSIPRVAEKKPTFGRRAKRPSGRRRV